MLPIRPVIDCSHDRTGIETTLESIEAAGPAPDPMLIERPEALLDACPPGGAWICIIRAGDRLASRALEIYARAAIDNPDASLIYADDDLLAARGREAPHFKPSWNPELFEQHDFLTGSAIIRVVPEMLAGLASQDWAETLTRRAALRGEPVRLPAILHHRSSRPEPHVPGKAGTAPGSDAPLVSIIVPTRDRLPLLKTCIEGVQRTNYPRTQLIIVDNESRDAATLSYLEELKREGAQVEAIPGPFNFSRLNNAAARKAEGELLCFLNNDVEMIEDDWLSMLVPRALQDDIGAVGARLLYPDGTIQHAGVVTGVGGGAAHAHRSLGAGDDGYFLRHRLPQRVSAVTAACLVVAKSKFFAVGGFDEEEFPVAFNDVDLCLKLNSRGWQSFYEPRAVLVHHESKSRGSDSLKENRTRFAGELQALKRRWVTDQVRDPYHHPQLSPFCDQFFVAV